MTSWLSRLWKPKPVPETGPPCRMRLSQKGSPCRLTKGHDGAHLSILRDGGLHIWTKP